MIEGSSVQEHGVKMLSLVEKLKDLNADLAKETYIDMILQSLPPSFDSFIVNYNMNGLEKDLHELINILVQCEATIEKSAPSVLLGEASTSKVKGKAVGRWKTKALILLHLGMGKGKTKAVRQSLISKDVCINCHEKGHWKRKCPKLLSNQGGEQE
ncbi:UNVERIFIED_CONTAM: hypothetical protein Slati_1362600 [Sesamum latifolium]|uniref:CCHC-type domain-containing protein n=1 Tax=Sesamum latifolium TaxID=2727402 RepID=A0AAW2XJG5_9LAMI